MSKRTRLLIVGLVVTGLVGVVVAGRLGWRAYINHQPTLSDDLPYLDQAIAAVLTGAGDEAAVAVAGIVQSTVCHPSALVSGGEFTRAADLYASPGDEGVVISRIAARLPASFHAQRASVPAGTVAPLLADAGHGVQLSVRRLGDGWLVVRAHTGCTTTAHQQSDAATPTVGTSIVEDVLTELGTRASNIGQEILSCTAGSIVTVTAISQPTASGNLASRIASQLPAGAHPFAATANRAAYRDGRSSVIVAPTDDATAITVRRTTDCG